MSLKFNEESEKPRFMFKANPLVPNSWQIFEWKEEKDNYEPVADYTLIDLKEAIDITEKKLINMMAVMNGSSRLIDFTNLTESRVFYSIEGQESSDETPIKIVFRTHDGKGVSNENAVLTIEKGVYDDLDTSELRESS